MVDYGISIMAFLRFCKIGYHWKAFEGIVKWPYQITDWNPVCIFNLQFDRTFLQKVFEFEKYWYPISFSKYRRKNILIESNVSITWITK